jgi:hypothetical protein
MFTVGENCGEMLAPLLSTAMEAEDPDAGLGSRLVLQMSVGPDCHSGVLVSSKTQVFVPKWSGTSP